MPGDLGEDTKPDVKLLDLFSAEKDEPKSESSAGYDNNSDITNPETVKQKDEAVVEIYHAEYEGEDSSPSTVSVSGI